jgi:hypothetical protein
LPRKALFRSLNFKISAIAVLVIGITVALFFFNALSIQAILVLWNFGAVAALVLWERERRREALNSESNYSNDARWTKTKMDLEKVENKLGKAKDPLKKRALSKQRDLLDNELRRLEWAIREANMNSIYNSQKGGLKRPQGPNGKNLSNSSNDELSDSPSKIRRDVFDPLDRLGARAAIRRRAELELENKDRQTLLKTLDCAEAIVAAEPAVSLRDALQPIANDCKAHYNLIKKRGKLNSAILGDYWVVWSLVLSLQNRLPFESSITKYASKDFKTRATKFMKSVDSMRYSKSESIPVVQDNQKEDLVDVVSDTRLEYGNNGSPK